MTSVVEEHERQGPEFAYPAGFRFGTATAAYQIEGAWDEDGRGESIWDRFCHEPGNVARGETGDLACDHYHRWREDVDLIAALRIESYRFSISWPRVQPDGCGALNPRGVEFYRRLAEELRERGIEPVATLYHWDLPQALQDGGGWASRDVAERFADYARLMAEQLGDVVAQWITHNEPWVVAFLGHATGAKAPGVRDWATALRVSHHLLLSHGLAAQALRAALPPRTPVGITLNLQPERPLTDSSADRAAARIADGYANRWFLDPVLRGSYPEDMLEVFERSFGPPDSVRAGDLETIAQPLDFLGVNYYFPQRVAADPEALPLGVRHDAPLAPLTTMGWEQDPSGLEEILLRIRADYARLMAEQLGDVVAQWITHNEPWVVAFLGHATGAKAPGVRDWATALRVSHHLLLSHGLAAQALRAALPPRTPVGITLNLQPERPLTDSSADRAAARIADGYANRWFLDPVLRGSYPEDMLEVFERSFGPPDSVRAGDLETIAQPLDFLGVNYYFPQRVAADPEALPLGVRHDAPLAPLTTMGWEQDPSGLEEILLRIRADYGDLPLYITENGAAFEDGEEVDGCVEDPARVEYLRGHVAAVRRAIAAGVDVRRYFVWSLLDNFEWERGYSQRFGIVHVDFGTQRRVPKRSALWYRDHIAAVRGSGSA